MGAGFTVDAHADLHLVICDLEAGFSGSGHGAGREAHAHGAGVGDDLFGNAGHFLQGSAFFCFGTGDLVDKDCACHAPAAGGVQRILHGYIVIHDDALYGDTVHFGQFAGHFKVHNVAGIVFDDQQHAGRSSNGVDGSLYLIGGGRSKHGPGYSSIQHTISYETAVSGLMAGTAAGDQSDLIGLLVLANENGVPRELLEDIGMRLGDALDHFDFHVFNLVD